MDYAMQCGVVPESSMPQPRSRASSGYRVTIDNRIDVAGGYTDVCPQLRGAVCALMLDTGAPITVTARFHEGPVLAVNVIVNGRSETGVLAQAARSIAENLGVRQSVVLEVKSMLPPGAGGGGSSQI